MEPDQKVLVIIPARGGSVSIPRKNVQQLGDKPLLAWAITAAQEAAELREQPFRITVNTEDKEIAKVAKQYGAEVFDRPPPLAEDVPTEQVLLHQLKKMKKDGYEPDIFLCVQCTTPFKSGFDISMCITGLMMQDKIDSCIAMKSITEYPQWFYKIIRNVGVSPFLEVQPWLKEIIGWIGVRQTLPRLVLPTGGVYAHWTKKFLKHKSMFGKRTIAYIMPPERSFDVDEPLDLEVLQALVEWRTKIAQKTKSKKKIQKRRSRKSQT